MAAKDTHITNASLKDPIVLAKVGKLIRGWVDGSIKRPVDEEAARQALWDEGVRFKGRVKKVKIVDLTEDTFVMMLPQQGQIERIVTEIRKDGRQYQLPDAIKLFVTNPPADDAADEKEAFYEIRLADYTLQHCGGD